MTRSPKNEAPGSTETAVSGCPGSPGPRRKLRRGDPRSTQRWRRLAAAALAAAAYVCQRCNRRAAVAVHHKTPLHKGGDPFPGLEGLEAVCRTCHDLAHSDERSRVPGRAAALADLDRKMIEFEKSRGARGPMNKGP